MLKEPAKQQQQAKGAKAAAIAAVAAQPEGAKQLGILGGFGTGVYPGEPTSRMLKEPAKQQQQQAEGAKQLDMLDAVKIAAAPAQPQGVKQLGVLDSIESGAPRGEPTS